jgi:hypothetical protein
MQDDNYYDLYNQDSQGAYAESPYAYAPSESQSGGTIPGNMNQMQMAGLLIASGMPFSKAMIATSRMESQANARAMQNYKVQMMQQKMLQSQGTDKMFGNLLNGGTAPTNGTPMPGNANTLAEMNATSEMPTQGDAVDPSSPNNIYTQMDDPNRVAGPSVSSMPSAGMGSPTSLSNGQLSPEVKQMATLMYRSGDKKGAIKYLMNARAQGAGNGFEKNPMMGPSRGGQGGTYINPKTGEAISSDTNKQTSQDQATVAAIQRLEPMMDDIIQNLPQFQTGKMQTKLWAEKLSNYALGTNFDLPSKYALGQSALKAVPDPLLKILGISSTDKGLDTVRGIIEPTFGESPELYKQRAINQLLRFREDYAEASKERLLHGIPLTAASQAKADIQLQHGNENTESTQALPISKRSIQDLSDQELLAIASRGK